MSQQLLLGTAAAGTTVATGGAATPATAGLFGTAGGFSLMSTLGTLGTVAGVLGTISSANAASSSAKFEAAQMDLQAKNRELQATQKANELRKRTLASLATARAASAASGTQFNTRVGEEIFGTGQENINRVMSSNTIDQLQSGSQVSELQKAAGTRLIGGYGKAAFEATSLFDRIG